MSTYKRSAALALAAIVAIAGCSGKDGKNGTSGAAGVSTGTLSGTVTISGTALPVVGGTVALSPAIAANATTDATGKYSFTSLPAGVYTVTFSGTNLTAQTKTISILADEDTAQNVALVATAKVVVGMTVTGTATPGATLNATVATTPMDGSTVTSIAWTTGVNAQATFGTASAAATTAVLPDAATFKDNLFRVLDVSPLADPDSGILPPEEPPLLATVQDRFQVQPINHFDLERAGEVILTATVTTSSGAYSVTKTVATTLPYAVATGLANVPVNVPVVVHGKQNATYTYTLAGPSGDATSALDSTSSQNVVFTPTTSGKYTLTNTANGAALDIYAGTWVGAIDAAATLANLDANGAGTPVGGSSCLGCHDGGTAPDNFTPWAQSGHAQIFSDNVNAGGHYTSACFDCHMVGYSTLATNNGVDEQTDYAAMLAGIFTVGGSPATNPLNWKNILTNYPNTAAMANIQCENCHGPNQVTSNSHSSLATRDAMFAARVSVSAGVCGRCHGEPARHGRYQEWSISGHGNFEVAINEGTNTGCSGCHSAQGALDPTVGYFQQISNGIPSRTLTALPAGLTVDNVQPQTCVVCHDPHNPGSTSSLGTNAEPRFMDDTPMLPSGFKAVGVGKGAMCIVCHNSRNGGWNNAGTLVANLHEDGDAHFGTLTAFAAPHEAAQGDVLMGRNGYFVSGVRGPHSVIPNACVNCHMDSVAAPAEIGYSTQSNHTFEANLTICAKCHGSFDGAGLQAATQAGLDDVKATMESKLAGLYETVGTTIEIIPGRTPLACVNGCLPIVPPATQPANAVNLIDYMNGKAASAATKDLFMKANWNYELVAVDNSGGVHNPSFVQDVLFRTSQKISAITAP
jgi:hypothetical protein